MDMAQRNFFNHLDPDGFDGNDRVRQAGMHCLVTENIGVYRTSLIPISHIVDDLMTSFYNSELHRANILNPDITHVGIGFYQDTNGYDNPKRPTHEHACRLRTGNSDSLGHLWL